MIIRTYILVMLVLFMNEYSAFGQRKMSEGVITYSVTLEPPANQEGVVQYNGTYTITVKGKQLKKEFILNNGFESIMIYGENKPVYSLKTAGDKKYAIQLNQAATNKQYEKFEGFTLKDIGASDPVLGLVTRKGLIVYKDGSTAEIIYAAEIVPEENIFDRFPSIQVLPMDFSFTTDEGVILHFHVREIKETPVESVTFKVPMDYKIISNDEYRKLR